MAKTAKRRRAVSRSASGKAFVKTGKAAKAVQRLLDELTEAKRGETGWSLPEHVEVEKVALLLQLTLKKIGCPPTESLPKARSHQILRRLK